MDPLFVHGICIIDVTTLPIALIRDHGVNTLRTARMTAKDLYDTIGCKIDAPPEEVRKAARLTLLSTHPDKNSGFKDMSKLDSFFNCTRKAQEILCDEKTRRVYTGLLLSGVLIRHGGTGTDFDAIKQKIEDYIYYDTTTKNAQRGHAVHVDEDE
jgi:DnaJ-class molecular chaperone